MKDKEDENQESEELENKRGLDLEYPEGSPFSMTVTPCFWHMISPEIFPKNHCQTKKRRKKNHQVTGMIPRP